MLVLFKPNMYLPKKVDAVSCAFCSRDTRCFVMLVGLVFGGLNGMVSLGITCISGGLLGGWSTGGHVGRGGRVYGDGSVCVGGCGDGGVCLG